MPAWGQAQGTSDTDRPGPGGPSCVAAPGQHQVEEAGCLRDMEMLSLVGRRENKMPGTQRNKSRQFSR